MSQAYLGAPAGDDLLAVLVERSEGNPFFGEQILHYLVELGQVEQVDGTWRLVAGDQSPLPGDVNALLVARLDRLDPGVREVVQTAAVLGREFELRVLAQMLPGQPDLPGKLATAEQEAIWSAVSEDRYQFKHALLREAAYRMQLRARRQSLHKLALAAIESLPEADFASLPQADFASLPQADFASLPQAGISARFGELAYHALAADLPEPAFRYSLLAGNQAMEKYAAAEAVNHYRPAMELLGKVEASSAQRRQLCSLYGRALELTGDPAAALAHYQSMEKLARELGDRSLELDALVAQGTLRSTGNVMSDFELAELLGRQGLNLAQALNDRTAEAKILWNLTNVYRLTGRYEQSLASGLLAFELAEASGLREQMAYIANDLSRAYMGLGQVSEMLANSRRTVELWREVRNQPMLIDGLANYGMALAMTGQFTQALAIAEEGIALSQASNNLWGEAFMRYTPVLVHLQRLQIEAGLEHAAIALRLAQESGASIVQFYLGLFQFLLHLAANDVHQAFQSAEQSLAVASQHFKFQKPAASAALAIACIEMGEMDKADELVSSYQVDPESLGMLLLLMPELARCWYLSARGQYTDLLPLTKQITQFAGIQGLSFLLPQFFLLQAQAQLAIGDRSAARASLESGLALLRQTGGRWGLAELSGLMDKIG